MYSDANLKTAIETHDTIGDCMNKALFPASPIIPWMGGKRRLAQKLFALFPPHHCYVEAFCGGAALYFLRPEPAHIEVINDVNGELINLYRVVQHHLEEFVRQFKWAITSRQIFTWHKITPSETLTDIQRAARFYYLQQHSFGGNVASRNFGTTTTSKPFNLLRIEEDLSAAHLRLVSTRTCIENLPWMECVERYDRPHTFFYLDPPYWEVAGYGVPFDFHQYEKMAAIMQTCKGKIMLSINDHPDIRQVFKDFPMLDLEIIYSTANSKGKRKKSNELVIMNWEQNTIGTKGQTQNLEN